MAPGSDATALMDEPRSCTRALRIVTPLVLSPAGGPLHADYFSPWFAVSPIPSEAAIGLVMKEISTMHRGKVEHEW